MQARIKYFTPEINNGCRLIDNQLDISSPISTSISQSPVEYAISDFPLTTTTALIKGSTSINLNMAAL
ncbi:MAG: hypothetical protein ACFFBF_16950 [Promethearchaeota archaeon]